MRFTRRATAGAALLAGVLLAPLIARAGSVTLVDGTLIENVDVLRVDDKVVVWKSAKGIVSTRPRSEVASVVLNPVKSAPPPVAEPGPEGKAVAAVRAFFDAWVKGDGAAMAAATAEESRKELAERLAGGPMPARIASYTLQRVRIGPPGGGRAVAVFVVWTGPQEAVAREWIGVSGPRYNAVALERTDARTVFAEGWSAKTVTALPAEAPSRKTPKGAVSAAIEAELRSDAAALLDCFRKEDRAQAAEDLDPAGLGRIARYDVGDEKKQGVAKATVTATVVDDAGDAERRTYVLAREGGEWRIDYPATMVENE